MFQLRKIAVIFVLTYSICNNSSAFELNKGKAAMISGAVALTTSALIHTAVDRLPGCKPKGTSLAIGAIAGLSLGAITYAILYYNFVNEGPCNLCGDRKNSWGHIHSEEVKINCGHIFKQNCLENYTHQNGEKCPICKADIFNKFPVVHYSYSLF